MRLAVSPRDYTCANAHQPANEANPPLWPMATTAGGFCGCGDSVLLSDKISTDDSVVLSDTHILQLDTKIILWYNKNMHKAQSRNNITR